MSDDIKKGLYECSSLRNYDFMIVERSEELEIFGKVSSYYHKQIVQEIVKRILNLRSSKLFLKNELIVG